MATASEGSKGAVTGAPADAAISGALRPTGADAPGAPGAADEDTNLQEELQLQEDAIFFSHSL